MKMVAQRPFSYDGHGNTSNDPVRAPFFQDHLTGETVWDNDVSCGSGTATPAGVIYAGPNGVEVCNDGSGALPLQGRIIATTDGGGYIAADGDKDNPEQAQGWVRVGSGGVRCGDSAGPSDATHPTAADTMDDCG